MGLLDEVIRAALSGNAPAPSAQAQPPRNTSSQDPFSQIAVALQELLAPKQGTGSSSSPAAGPAGQQGSLGGLDVLIDQFKKNGLEGVMKSWIGTGENQQISPTQLRQTIGEKTVADLARQSGSSQDDLLSQLAKYLPGVIDKLTPNGQLPGRADLGAGYRNN